MFKVTRSTYRFTRVPSGLAVYRSKINEMTQEVQIWRVYVLRILRCHFKVKSAKVKVTKPQTENVL